MPFKHHAARRHRFRHARSCIRNWPAYEVGLGRHIDLTLCADEAAYKDLARIVAKVLGATAANSCPPASPPQPATPGPPCPTSCARPAIAAPPSPLPTCGPPTSGATTSAMGWSGRTRAGPDSGPIAARPDAGGGTRPGVPAGGPASWAGGQRPARRASTPPRTLGPGPGPRGQGGPAGPGSAPRVRSGLVTCGTGQGWKCRTEFRRGSYCDEVRLHRGRRYYRLPRSFCWQS